MDSKVPFSADQDVLVDALAASPALHTGFQRTDGPARLTRFHIKFDHLQGPLQLRERCSPGGLVTYWTRSLKAHIVSD